MLHFRRASTLVSVLAAMLLPATAAAHGPHPLVAKQQWIDCTTGHMRGAAPYSVWPDLWAAQRGSDSYRVALLERIAHVPQAKWLAGKNVRQEPSRIIGTYVRNTIAPEWGGPNCSSHYGSRGGAGDPFVGNYPVFAIRQLEHLDCGSGYHGGNDWNTARNGKYLPWIERFVDALRPIDHNAAVIVEPDGLPVIPKCLSRRAGKERLGLMRATLRRLGSVPNLTTYIDVGSS